ERGAIIRNLRLDAFAIDQQKEMSLFAIGRLAKTPLRNHRHAAFPEHLKNSRHLTSTSRLCSRAFDESSAATVWASAVKCVCRRDTSAAIRPCNPRLVESTLAHATFFHQPGEDSHA